MCPGQPPFIPNLSACLYEAIDTLKQSNIDESIFRFNLNLSIFIFANIKILRFKRYYNIICFSPIILFVFPHGTIILFVGCCLATKVFISK